MKPFKLNWIETKKIKQTIRKKKNCYLSILSCFLHDSIHKYLRAHNIIFFRFFVAIPYVFGVFSRLFWHFSIFGIDIRRRRWWRRRRWRDDNVRVVYDIMVWLCVEGTKCMCCKVVARYGDCALFHIHSSTHSKYACVQWNSELDQLFRSSVCVSIAMCKLFSLAVCVMICECVCIEKGGYKNENKCGGIQRETQLNRNDDETLNFLDLSHNTNW